MPCGCCEGFPSDAEVADRFILFCSSVCKSARLIRVCGKFGMNGVSYKTFIVRSTVNSRRGRIGVRGE